MSMHSNLLQFCNNNNNGIISKLFNAKKNVVFMMSKENSRLEFRDIVFLHLYKMISICV